MTPSSFLTARTTPPLAAVLALTLAAFAAAAAPAAGAAGGDPAAAVVATVPAGPVRDLLQEILAKNPDLQARAAAAEAAARRGDQAGALPDPVLATTTYLQDPETRVGPQKLMLSLTQRIPWPGTLGLKRAAADSAAAAARADLRAARLRLVTETRGLCYELGFLAENESVVRDDRAALTHYEEVARARYASGVGLEQAVVKIQAELTRDDARLLEIATRRAALAARLNALRDAPGAAVPDLGTPPRYPEYVPDVDALRAQAAATRPELAAADARIRQAEAQAGVARKAGAPGLNLGLTYGVVGTRSDPAGLASPPPDNGRDVLGVVAGVSLPLWRGKVRAGIDEASLLTARAEENRRSVLAGIDRSLDDLADRLPLTWRRVRLYEDELSVQAEQSLHSAESAYAAGTVGALDLLDAERVLLQVRIAAARARTDYAVAVADLEGATGVSLNLTDPNREQH